VSILPSFVTMPGDPPNGVPLVNGVPLQRNLNGDNGWIVQKFGGTSVGKFAEKIAEDVLGFASQPHRSLTPRSHMKNNRIALVCSARSAATKVEGTTNR
jgi:aspartate kinase